jgi:anti-sigma-K factor RskA
MNDDLHTLVGAYALDALPPAERGDFERHLEGCDTCVDEVRGLRETTARLGTAVAVRPPDRLRSAVFAEIGAVRQAPPALAEVRPLRSWLPRLTAGLAAACLVAAMVTGAVAFRTQQRLDQVEAAGRAATAVLAAPDAQSVTQRVGSGGTATVVSSRQRGQVVFAVSGMPPLAESQDLQVWFMGPERIRSAGLIEPGERPLVAGSIADANRMGITVEPKGGSPQPTTDPLAVLAIA